MPHNRLSQVAHAGMVGLVGAALLLLPGVADQPRMRPVAEILINDPFLPVQWNLLGDDPAGIRALDAWDDEWHFAAKQGEHGYVYTNDVVTGAMTGPLTVRYGAYRRGWIYALKSGDFTCGPSDFPGDDPAPYSVKRCEIAPYWINAVNTGDWINPPTGHGEETWVRYGVNGLWRYAKIDHSVQCGVGLVGGIDPAPGRGKICQMQRRHDGGGVVADEGGWFTTPATDPDRILATSRVTVRYGAVDHWVYKDLPANTDEKCVPATFGEDPYLDVVKHCEIVKSMGTGVTIASIDNGSLPHPDLDAKLVPGLNFYNPTKTNADDCPVGNADLGHGLATASVAAAETHNRQGIAGVAPMAKVSQVKVDDCSTNTFSSQAYADAIRWAAGLPTLAHVPPILQTAKIVSIQIGHLATDCDFTVQAAIDAAMVAGTYVIASAGNEAEDLATANRFPIDCEGVAPIAAVDRSGRKRPSSNFGDKVRVAAPGGDIPVLSASAAGGVRTNAAGTSYAAPEVAGVAALMFGKNPKLTVTNVNNRIQLSSREFPTACIGCGVGLLDADRAMRSAEAITQETEPNDQRGTANYVSAPADVAGQLTPRIPFSMCNQTCPPLTPSPDQDWFLLELPPGQTLAAWARTLSPCVNCYLDIITDMTATKTYAFSDTAAFSATARLVNTSPTHQDVYIRVWTTEKNLSPSYTLFTSWRDERRPDGTVGVEKTELR